MKHSCFLSICLSLFLCMEAYTQSKALETRGPAHGTLLVIGGGRQWRHADSYLDTKTHRAFFKLLDRGGVIAGSSAGATIQGSYLSAGPWKPPLLYPESGTKIRPQKAESTTLMKEQYP
jgi:hypothetical protein